MNKKQVLLLLLICPALTVPSFAQATIEFGGTHARVVNLGSGFNASSSRSSVAPNPRQSTICSQQALLLQNNAVQQYMNAGCTLETKKHWAEAEDYFKYVLKVIARRDGPGSIKSLPALEHLVIVTKNQSKLNDAISYQKTVLAFKKAAEIPNLGSVVKAQNDLASLLEQKFDYVGAEKLLKESIELCNSSPSAIPESVQQNTRLNYANILGKLSHNAGSGLTENTSSNQ